ncbi:MAG: hypothetical protein IAF38_04655 [Bacteroidia bacterium]|nr:hypothetical protein [Bacteroidia bacterium]
MTKFSRKKIRGFDRKLKQLDRWKNFILTFPADNINKTAGVTFRIHLSPFIWFGDKNPHIKFHKHLYKAYFDILQKLKGNRDIINNDFKVQLWLYYPRTVRSIIFVGPEEQYQKRNGQIKPKETKLIPPRLFGNYFDEFTLKIGDDNIFESIDNNNENTEWLTHRQGDVWTVE